MRNVSSLLSVPTAGGDDARRRRLLNIWLVGIAIVVLLGLVATAAISRFESVTQQELVMIYGSGLAVLVGSAIIFLINRYWSGGLASTLFLVLLTFVFLFSDEPSQVVDGRSLFTFAISMIMASFLLRSWASFMIAGLSGILLAALALSVQLVPNLLGVFGLFAVALASWLSARSMESAIEEVRVINRELDQRVIERTRDLAEALAKNQAILESIADGVIVFDDQDIAVVANPAIGSLLDKPGGDIVQRNIAEILGEAVDAQGQQTITQLLQDKQSRRPSVKLQWGRKTLSVSFAPVARRRTSWSARWRSFAISPRRLKSIA